MRELKFRAWNDTTKTMYEPELLSGFDGSPMHSEPDDGVYDDKGEVTIEQYTGLKDKHGKEIYEGDIVEWREGPKRSKVRRYAVEWAAGFDSGGYPSSGFTIPADYIYKLRLIGNIHENPELLEKGR